MRYSAKTTQNRGGTRWGFPMAFDHYKYENPIADGEQDGVILHVAKERTKDGREKFRVSVGFRGGEGYVRVEYHAAEGTFFLSNVVDCVTPELAVEGGDLETFPQVAWGRLVRCEIGHETYQEKERAKIKRFVPEVNEELKALGVQEPPPEESTEAVEGEDENPFGDLPF